LFGYFVPYPATGGDCLGAVEALVRKEFSRKKAGAVLVEPVQVRGGIKVPPLEFLPMLRRLCDEHDAVLILDEIYTGFGRTGKWFACEHSGVIPDIVCLGKALTGGFPLSACIGRASIMDKAWPVSDGEAIHTSTFLGHPVGCAMALAQIHEIKKRKLVQRSARLGQRLLSSLQSLVTQSISRKTSRVAHDNLELQARGLGLLAGLECLTNGKPATKVALEVIKEMLHDGFVMLPEGEYSNVLGLTPPLIISEAEIEKMIQALSKVLFRPGDGLGN
jgi:4-aminobutyrate aminotransferase-like enzyme